MVADLCHDLQVATQTVAQMLALEAIDPHADIKLYINSLGKRGGLQVSAAVDSTVAAVWWQGQRQC